VSVAFVKRISKSPSVAAAASIPKNTFEPAGGAPRSKKSTSVGVPAAPRSSQPG
jgi:hypothetical protein